MTNTLIEQIKARIQKNGQGWCFMHNDFADLGNYEAVRKTLSRLHDSGFIHRITTGMYYFPKYRDALGELPPQIGSIIDAMKRAYHIRCQPSGAYAANLLGISEQVPAKVVILTDGPSKIINAGNREIIFKKTIPKNMATADMITGLIIQAIKFIGKEHITNQHMMRLKRALTEKDILELKRNAYLAPAWIAKIINERLIGE